MFQVLYEDDDIIVINKPFGVVVNRAASVKGKTVQEWMESKVKDQRSKVKIEDGEFKNRGHGGRF